MSALLALASPFIPYIIAGLVALVGGGGYVWNAKRKAKNEGIAQQQAKEAESRAKNLEAIKRAAGAKPVGSVSDDPNNLDR